MSAMARTAGPLLRCWTSHTCIAWWWKQDRPGVTVYHAVQEEGVSLRDIAETIGNGLKVPSVSMTPEQAGEHYGWLAHFAALDMPASSEWTRKTLAWNPTGPGMIEDLTNMKYD